MKSFRTTTIALAGTVLLSVGALAACSSGGTSDFCKWDASTIDATDPNASVKFYEDWKAVAPADLAADFDIVIEGMKAATSQDPEAMAAVDAQKMADATTKISNAYVEKCS
ncbi:MAG: hypothetical protein FWD11_03630 [Micrococcales bacterium]|nr:hypothetical protein [Micrococcales bacterium]